MTHKAMVIITQEQYAEAEEELAGVCGACGELVNHGSVEPDAEHYECEACGEKEVMGVPHALTIGFLDIGEHHSISMALEEGLEPGDE